MLLRCRVNSIINEYFLFPADYFIHKRISQKIRKLLIFDKRFLWLRNYVSYLLNRNRGMKEAASLDLCTLKLNLLYGRSISYHSSSVFFMSDNKICSSMPFNVEKSSENQQIRAILSLYLKDFIFALVLSRI